MTKIILLLLSISLMLTANNQPTSVKQKVIVSTIDSINTEKQAARDTSREAKFAAKAAARLAKTEKRELKLKALNEMLLKKAEKRNLATNV
ncbi:hypothetical protein JHD48_09020 [Sulfurimonas sp. SAG-AH-194-I05]|nr:hypothetical protein [Sulfurimonas sp. SAG-AH-194-I05]MDF1875875.1 hypothetical protein [Sulfurimonas sp. SAG-AH-194-I05]